MRLRTPLLFTGLAVSLAAAFTLSSGGSSPPAALAGSAPPGPTARVALLVTQPGGGVTSLYVAPLGASSREGLAPVGSISHLEGGSVRGTVIPGTEVVLAEADTVASRDPSFAASLFRLSPHKPAERLCDGVVHASRPLATRGGRVFVARGKAGPEVALPSDPSKLKGAGGLSMRVDDLSVDEVDVATGKLSPLHTYSGYLTFIAGAYDKEVLLYRVGPGGADLVGVDMDSGGVRAIAPKLLPFARDFSVDEAAGELVFQERDEQDSRTWVIDRMNLKTGARTRVFASKSMALGPFAWPGGGIGYTPDGKSGMVLFGGAGAKVSGPLGAGVDYVEAVSPDKTYVAAMHTQPSQFGVPFAMATATGSVYALPAPAGMRVEIAGFVAAGGGK